jgi:ABC-type Fe3+-hydroxamate transport system substrate-binding protein
VTRILRALALLLGAACTRPSGSAGPLVDDAGVAVNLAAPPRRIVSLIPATTELVFALGAGDRLVGRTTWCDYPAQAAAVPDLGNGIGPNVEAVVAARPDLVLLYRSSSNAAAAGRFRSLGIPVLELRTDLIADFNRIALLLGRVLGVQRIADSLIEWVSRDIEAASAPTSPTSPTPPTPPTVFLLSWNRPPITLGSGSYLSEIVAFAGARNVFADLPAPSAPVSIEAVATRNPDFILTSAVDLPEIARSAEWQVVPAVRERRFVKVRGSEFNRPSPRIGTAIRELRAALDSLRR